MTSLTSSIHTPSASQGAYIQNQIERAIDSLITSLPDPERLSADQRRGIVARYTAVLEGNFIYWMTAAYLSVRSEEARSIILENLHEEVRDCHPGMLRKFAIAANAVPTDSDALAVYRDLTNVRLFLGRLSAVPIVVTMAFFEGYIQRFMAFLAKLATEQGSLELEYTDVHGVCDVAHTQGLYRALAAEMALNPPESGTNLFEGVDLLSALLQSIVPAAKSPKQHPLMRSAGATAKIGRLRKAAI
jgi:hypothetical protein